MCQFKSGIITKNKIYLAPIYNDSHSRLLESIGIEDNRGNAMRKFVRAELVPPGNDKMANIENWKFRVDQDIVPDWFEEDPDRYESEMRDVVAEWMKKCFVTICGKLCMKIKEDEKGTYYMLAHTLFKSEFGEANNYATSTVRKRLQECEFAKELKKEYGDRLVPITTNLLSLDGFDDYGIVEGDILALRTLDLHRECRKNIMNDNSWEWIATPYSTPSNYGAGCVCFVDSDGILYWLGYDYGCGVRPFFILKDN